MGPCRFLRPGGRIVRMTRGLLILLSALAIFGTIAFIHRMETGSKFNSDGNETYNILFQRATRKTWK